MRDRSNQSLSQQELLARMAHDFFAYHGVSITYALITEKTVQLVSTETISTRLRERFFDKFELDKNMNLNVIKQYDDNFRYTWEAPKSDIEKIIELWTNISLPFMVNTPICYIPEDKLEDFIEYEK